MSLLAYDALAKHINKDPEGFGKDSGIVLLVYRFNSKIILILVFCLHDSSNICYCFHKKDQVPC